MSARPMHLTPVSDTDLPEYPLAADERLTTHYFMPLHFRRWINSRFRLLAPPDVRGLAFDLWCLSQDQTPVGTLPADDAELSAMLGLDLRTWQSYLTRDWTPLYKWQRCRCGGEIRLMHPVVTEMVIESIGRREKKREEAEEGRRRKRMDRLPDQVIKAGGRPALAMNAVMLDWLDLWLMNACPGNRTVAWVRKGLEVWSLDHADNHMI